MRQYCQEAKAYGHVKAPAINTTLKKVLVVLNPAAGKKKCEENFEEFCAPILNLAGYNIDIYKSKSELDAIRYIEEELTEYPDAIVVAGGDGTLGETVTGLLRRAENNPQIPTIGVLPLGQLNMFSMMLLNAQEMPKNKLQQVKSMADAAMNIVKERSQKKDLMKIDLLPDAEEEVSPETSEPKKAFYATGSLFWGSFNDILKKKEKYWYTGSLRNYTAFLFNGFHRNGITWNCRANLIYSDPCQGCSNCYEKIETQQQKLQSGRWWSIFNPKDLKNALPDYSRILNPNCLNTTEETIDTSELVVTTNGIAGSGAGTSNITVAINTKPDDYGFEFIWNSWKRLKDRRLLEIPQSRIIEARTLQILPVKEDSKEEVYYSIDNEQYEVKPIKITLLPRRAEFFTTL